MAKEKGMNDVVQITSLEVPTYLRICEETGQVAALMGPPGVGKSKSVDAYAASRAKELTLSYNNSPTVESWKNPTMYNFGVLLTSVIEETDVIGYPHIVEDGGAFIAKYALNELLPIEGRGIVFFDEFPNGRSQVQNALQRILLEHRLGNYVISKDIQFVVAGNRPQDNCGTYNIPSAARNRVCWFEVSRPSIPEHLELMENIGEPIEPEIAGWTLSIGSKYFDNFDPKAEQYAFGTMRSMTKASVILGHLKKQGVKDYKIIEKAIGSCIGAGAGKEFVMFMKLTDKVDIEALLKKPEMINNYGDDLGVSYSITINLIDKFVEDARHRDSILEILTVMKRMELGVFMLKGVLTKMGNNKAVDVITKSKNGKPAMMKYHKLLQTAKGV